MSITVRYWAGAQAAAGVPADQLEGGTVGEVLRAAVAAHPGLEPVLELATVLQAGHRVEPGTAVAAGDEIEVLPPFAGG